MTYKELKAEADKLGYVLLKRQEKIKFLPCRCGHNRRSRQYFSREGTGYVRLICMKCGHKTGWAKGEDAARKLWNEEMK